MDLQQARTLAQEVVAALSPNCQRIEVVGSIRRKRPFPRDIDILLIPGNQGKLVAALQSLGTPMKSGAKIVQRLYKGQQVDLYFATPETWACLLLIRTGSKEHNIKLVSKAKAKGWHLYANGQGLWNGPEGAGIGTRIAGDTEESFFESLGLPYLPPERRET